MSTLIARCSRLVEYTKAGHHARHQIMDEESNGQSADFSRIFGPRQPYTRGLPRCSCT